MGFESVFRSGRLRTSLALAGLIVAAPYASNALAAAGGVEEITVTAQRTEESIQDVPIAVSAFTGAMLETKQIISPSDLQMNTPNVTFSATNFGGSSFSIRGIGRLVISASGDDGVSIHVNDIAMPTNLTATEFYDMERVEVLRGPQGTLYGKNATGGVVNMITAKPTTDAFSGNIDGELGNYADKRFKGALNIPITDTFAIRIAGMNLTRDGYIDNTAAGQVGCARGTEPGNTNGPPAVIGGPPTTLPCSKTTIPGLHNHMDGRDVYTYRITGLWDISENSTAWVMYSKFHENDDKVRITNQVCQRTQIPARGCTPDGFGFDAPNNSATTGGMFAGLDGLFLLGTPNPVGGFPVYKTGFRDQHTDFNPVYKYDEDLLEGNWSYNFDKVSVNIGGGYKSTTYLSQQDYNVDVGFDMGQSTAPLTAANSYPTSQPAGQYSADWTNSKCNFDGGTSGIFGGCIYPANQTRSFAYDQSDSQADYWTTEIKANTHFDGRFNFLVGANYSKGSANGDYYVVANTLDLVGTHGVPLLGFPPLYPTMFDATGAPNGGVSGDSTAEFGEMYVQIFDSLKLTVGVRHNDDKKEVADSSVLFNSLNACPIGLAPFLGTACNNASPVAPLGAAFIRTTLAPAFTPAAIPGMVGCILGAPCSTADQSAKDLMQYYGIANTYAADVIAGNIPGAFQSLLGVPAAPGYNEQRKLTGSPSQAEWKENTGRIGLDWQVTENSMLYGFFTRGYKPGGFNPPLNAAFVNSGTAAYTFKPEKVDAYEIGSKNALFDNSLTLNLAAFYYKYTGLQVSMIANNTSINGNMDAIIKGFELESVYSPKFLPNLTMNVNYGYLDATVDNTSEVDPLNRGAGDPNLITLKDIDAGSLTGVSFVANASALTPAFIQAAYAACGALASAPDGNANATCTNATGTHNVVPVANGTVYPVGFPGTVGGAAVPAYFSQNYLTDPAGNGTGDGANGKGAPCNNTTVPCVGNDTDKVFTSDGIKTNIDGNQLPNSPKNTISAGLQYAFNFSFGTITPRVDYSWLDSQYAREFNTKGDAIKSWSQWNASLRYMSTDARWEVNAWIRNIKNDDNITGKYLTSDTSGFFRNYFLTEPRVYGATVKYNFGALQ